VRILILVGVLLVLSAPAGFAQTGTITASATIVRPVSLEAQSAGARVTFESEGYMDVTIPVAVSGGARYIVAVRGGEGGDDMRSERIFDRSPQTGDLGRDGKIGSGSSEASYRWDLRDVARTEGVRATTTYPVEVDA
jgi:hypothetical protein